MLFDSYNKDIVALIFGFLEEVGEDIFNLKCSSSLLHQLINQTVPIHQFVYILQCIKNYESSIPALNISTHYFLNERVTTKIWDNPNEFFLKNPFPKEKMRELITKFVLLFHTNPFCAQVIQFFPFNFLFLSVVCQQPPYKDSCETFKRIAIWQRQTQLILGDNHRLIVNEKWLKEPNWNYALFSFKRPQSVFQGLIHWGCIAVTKQYMDQIIENKDLLCFLLYNFQSFQNKSDFIDKLLDPKCLEYFKDPFFAQILLNIIDAQQFEKLEEKFEFDKFDNIRLVKKILEVRYNERVWCYLPEKWKRNRQVILAALENQNFFVDYCTFVPGHFLNDKEFVLSSVKRIPTHVLPKEVVKKYKRKRYDPSFLKQLAITCAKGQCIATVKVKDYYPEYILKDKSICYNLEEMDVDSEEDVNWIKTKIQQHKISFSELSDIWQQNTEILKVGFLSGVKYQLIKDKELALYAVSVNGLNIKTLSTDLQNDMEIARVAVKQNGRALYYVGSNISSNVDLVYELFLLNSDCFSTMLQTDFIELWCKSHYSLQYWTKEEKTERYVQTVREFLRIALKRNIHGVYSLGRWRQYESQIIDESILKIYSDYLLTIDMDQLQIATAI